MQRITHIVSSPSGLGGAELLVASLAKYGHERGDQVDVLLPFRTSFDDSSLEAACAPARVHTRNGSGLRSFPLARRWLLDQLRRLQPDVVHTHLAAALLLGASLPRKLVPSLVTTHHHGDLFVAQGRRGAAVLEALALRRYDVVVAVSDAVADHLGTVRGLDPCRVKVIRNGWTGAPLPPAPTERPRIVCVGRLRREKGHSTLLEAFARVHAIRPEVSLDLVGDGPERGSLEQQVRLLHLDESVVFHGDLTSVWPLLQTATVAAQPSLVEQFGISALEAMAAGVPLVAADTGGLRLLLNESGAGLLVRPGDAGALAIALDRVLEDRALRMRLAAAGPPYASKFRLDRTLEGYGQLYDAIRGPRGG